jgi:hypothetical protein
VDLAVQASTLLYTFLLVALALQVGKDLTDVYWQPGNGSMFLDLVQQLTGKPLVADAWVNRLQRDTQALLAREKEQYEAAIKAGPK